MPKIYLSSSAAKAIKTEIAERRLIEFSMQAWPVIEPAVSYSRNWHLEAIAEHLEACINGQIRNLIINIPPRTSKSLSCCVFWPAWAWIKKPHLRWLFSSYSGRLSIRDSRKCREIIRSKWYQERWGDRYEIKDGKDGEALYENNHQGFRFSTTVMGALTGEGGDIVVCLPADELLMTDRGRLPIGEIVHNKDRRLVRSVNPTNGELEWKPITGWHENPGSEIVEVGLSDGTRLRCTPDHRIWTTSRGWIEAGLLNSADVLPSPSRANAFDGSSGDAQAFGDLFSAFRGAEDFLDDLFCEYGSRVRRPDLDVAFLSDVFGDSFPDKTGSDLLDSSAFHSKFGGEIVSSIIAGNDQPDVVFAEDRARPIDSKRERSMPLGVVDVLRSGSVFEVASPVVGRLAVEMPDFLSNRARSFERQQHDLMDEEIEGLAVSSCSKPGVSIPVVRRLEDSSRDAQRTTIADGRSRVTVNAPHVGHAIEGFKSRDRSPVFVRKVGYVDRTYCISVAGNHNFVSGSGHGVIVANCDDPHNVVDINSKPIREKVLEWWDDSMSTRLNDQKTGVKVVVMQRLNEKDLTGHLLAEMGSYEHLMLPMEYEPGRAKATVLGWSDPRKEEGESLWLDRFPPEVIASLKQSMSALAVAGQLQQRPAPKTGGTFDSNRFRYFQLVDRDGQSFVEYETADGERFTYSLNECRLFQAVDTAQKIGEENNYTVIITFVVTPRNDLLILDVFRKRIGIPEQYDSILEQRKKWPNVLFQAVEDKASGIGLIQEAAKNGQPFLPISPVGDKSQRCFTVTLLYQNGKMYHRAGAAWLTDFEDELAMFPRGEHDDQVDVVAYGGILFSNSGVLFNTDVAAKSDEIDPKTGRKKESSDGLVKRLGI